MCRTTSLSSTPAIKTLLRPGSARRFVYECVWVLGPEALAKKLNKETGMEVAGNYSGLGGILIVLTAKFRLCFGKFQTLDGV